MSVLEMYRLLEMVEGTQNGHLLDWLNNQQLEKLIGSVDQFTIGELVPPGPRAATYALNVSGQPRYLLGVIGTPTQFSRIPAMGLILGPGVVLDWLTLYLEGAVRVYATDGAVSGDLELVGALGAFIPSTTTTPAIIPQIMGKCFTEGGVLKIWVKPQLWGLPIDDTDTNAYFTRFVSNVKAQSWTTAMNKGHNLTTFTYLDVPASGTNYAGIDGDQTFTDFVMLEAGSLTSISARSNAAIGAGTLTIKAMINGSPSTLNVVLNSGNQSAITTQLPGVTAIAAGNKVGCQLVSSSLSANLDITILIGVENGG